MECKGTVAVLAYLAGVNSSAIATMSRSDVTSTVNVERRAGDVARVLGSEKENGSRDLLGAAYASQGDRRRHALTLVRRPRLPAGNNTPAHDGARRYCVNRDLERSDFRSKLACKAQNTGLGCSISEARLFATATPCN